MNVTYLPISEYNQRVEKEEPIEIVKELLVQYGELVVFTSSLGAEDQVLLDMLVKSNLPFKTITLDTGRLFPETYNLIEKTEKRLHTKIHTYFPHPDKIQEMVNTKGVNLFLDSVENRKLCCSLRKIEPLKRALDGAKVWLTGLRREQSDARTELPFAEWDSKFEVLKLNPIFSWTHEDIWNYIRAHQVPYNSLHDENFPSIGCAPCTRAVLPGEDIRAGRWWWEQKNAKECGLHVSE